MTTPEFERDFAKLSSRGDLQQLMAILLTSFCKEFETQVVEDLDRSTASYLSKKTKTHKKKTDNSKSPVQMYGRVSSARNLMRD
jgi:muramoyltetrapeptide carboxypeptidase LdcA involved in peptidoglycan recycling